MSTDLTFITNDKDNNLASRFRDLVKDTRFFDVLVGYFYTSGFYQIYPQLEKTEKIRILIGISTNKQTYDLLQHIKSHKVIKDEVGEKVKIEMEESKNTYEVEDGVSKFIKWIKDGKLEIKVYPEEKIHSKLYIMTFQDDDRDEGRVITGSSNFSKSGLVDNLEFNVELKNVADYNFAKKEFNKLWKEGIDVSDKYVETLEKKTWIREDISPYELYLKFLYEYFKEEINDEYDLEQNYRPENFKELKYQEHAVINAKKIIEEHNGVFLADVVGLGKTYMGTMLCQELKGRALVLAPPHLIDENNVGSWENSFRSFGFRAKDYKCESIGKLDAIVEKEIYKDYNIILIDESHRFRTDDNETYAKMAQICLNKKVILVTATPYNNSPDDLLSQIKLFQKIKNSTIPGIPNLDALFKKVKRSLNGLDRQRDKEEYIEVTKQNSKLLRERVLKHLMVRRTRKEIQKYYAKDLKAQKMSFPDIADPKPIFYELDEKENEIFFKTIKIITTKFKYSRYTPLLYHDGPLGADKQRQQNMMKFMRMLLVKRLESSFYAFTQSVDRFVISYEKFIDEFNNGYVYVSKKHIRKIFDYIDSGNLEAIDKLLKDDKAERYPISEFKKSFLKDLESDLKILRDIQELWKGIERDPKILAFKNKLAEEKPFKEGKSIIFTESEETAEYLFEELQDIFPNDIIYFSGKSSRVEREKVMENFDASTKHLKNDYKILITTDVLAEGINLHAANVVANYDIPWNPTKIMQRVGRINRVDTKHTKIYTYTFFPTEQSNNQIRLKELAQAKIEGFISMLGSDAKLLTESEIPEDHNLFNTILSKKAIEGYDNEEESELKYLQKIRNLRDEDVNLFDKIKKLPKKARTARKLKGKSSKLITYFRRGRVHKFVLSEGKVKINSTELDFIDAAKLLSAKPSEKRYKLNKDFYKLLDNNSKILTELNEVDDEEYEVKTGGRDNAAMLVKILKSKEIKGFKGFIEDDEEYIKKLIKELESGSIPKKRIKDIKKGYEENPTITLNPIKFIKLLKAKIPNEFLQREEINERDYLKYKKEVILSEYFNIE
jgi:superfamily II DNA/RNA helicase